MTKDDRVRAALIAVLGFAACGESSGAGLGPPAGTPDSGSGDVASSTCSVEVRDVDCNKSERPIVFVHGTYGSGDNIANVALLFGSNGFCQDRFVAVEYNSLGGNPQAKLDGLIDKVLADSGQDKVELMGHSQGTRHCYDYLADPVHAAKVAHYVHLAGGARPAPPAGVPTLSLASNSDTLLGAAGVSGAERSIVFETQDHFAVASSAESFVAIYNYLRGQDPKYREVQCGAAMVTLEGISESFADNIPVPGTLEVHLLGDSPRERGAPTASLTIGADGVIAPFQVQRLVPYEFRALDLAGKIVGHQYFAPFLRSNRLLRFLGPSTGLARIVTDAVVKDDRHVAVVGRYMAGAFRKDLGDSLTADGVEVLNDAIAAAATSTVGLFMFDANLNGQTDAGALTAYAVTPFVKGTDVFLQATTPAFIEMKLNGKTLKVPNWPSASEGQTLFMF
jgi:pimeloyl-ACP methyl ester carboxylesterase